MALILCLETSSKNCSVSISDNGKVLFSKDNFDENYCHGEKLHVLIESLLIESNILVENFDAFAFSAGPGSYTGLRIGAASVKGFAFALDKPIIAVSTLKSMVASLLNNEGIKRDSLFCPVLDSRKGEVYAALYDSNYNEHLTSFVCYIDAFSFQNYLDKYTVYFFGPGAYKLEAKIKHQNAIFSNSDYPSARFLSALAYEKFQENDFVDAAYFEPMYLKNFVPTKAKKSINK